MTALEAARVAMMMEPPAGVQHSEQEDMPATMGPGRRSHSCLAMAPAEATVPSAMAPAVPSAMAPEATVPSAMAPAEATVSTAPTAVAPETTVPLAFRSSQQRCGDAFG